MTASETVYGTIASSTVAVTASLTAYYDAVLVQNLATPVVSGAETQIIWVRADGTAAVKEADGCYAIMPGQSLLLDNGLAYWRQSQSVIPSGTMAVSSVSAPASITPMGSSLAGGVANPGTSVSIILDSGTTSTPFVVSSND
jgi:hypothetical protein